MSRPRPGHRRLARHTVAPLALGLLGATLAAGAITTAAAQPAPVVISPGAPVDSVSRDALAASLGVPNLANRRVNAAGDLLFREYIPAGETFDNWTRMLTVITVRIPDTHPASDSAAARLRAARFAE